MYKRILAGLIVAVSLGAFVALQGTAPSASAEQADEQTSGQDNAAAPTPNMAEAQRVSAQAHAASVAPALPQAQASLPELRELALDEASRSSDPTPSSITETETTLGAAEHYLAPTLESPGPQIPSVETPVYVISMTGNFTFNGPVPSEEPAPKGTVLTVAIEAASLRRPFEQLVNTVPDLHVFGATVNDLGR